jgi:hypothetical protein
MATRATLTPFSAEFPATNAPALTIINRRPALGYDATTAETAYWTLTAPQGLSGAQSLIVTYAMASATTGGIAFDVAVEAISDGDAVDTDSATSFDATNTATAAAVPGTAGFIDQVVVALTNIDSMAAGDYVRISVTRAVANAADTATGDLYLLAAEWRDSA